MKSRKVTSTILIIISIVVFIIVFMLNRMWVSDYQKELNQLNSEVTDIANSYAEEFKNTSDEETDVDEASAAVSTEEIANIYAQVINTSSAVADLENEYKKQLDIYGYDSENWEEAGEKLAEIEPEIESYFTEPLTYNVWYTWNKNSSAFWIPVVFLDYENNNVIPVIWECVMDDGGILAYVSSSYYVSDDKFDSCTIYITSLGQNTAAYDTDVEEEDVDTEQFVEDVTSIGDAMQELWETYDYATDPDLPNTNVVDEGDN